MLPWIQWHRERMTDDGDPFADEYLSCDHCRRRCDRQIRAMWHCGYIAERLHTGLGFQLPDGAPKPTVCPGYTTSLAEVYEAARALAWRKDGALGLLYDSPLTDPLRYCIDILDLEIRRVERHEMTMMRQRSKRDGHR